MQAPSAISLFRAEVRQANDMCTLAERVIYWADIEECVSISALADFCRARFGAHSKEDVASALQTVHGDRNNNKKG